MEEKYYEGEPLRIGNETQLLLDDAIVEDRWRLERVLMQPDKHQKNPIFTRTKPWEGDSAVEPIVLRDEEYGKYRMWYTSFSTSNYYGAGGPAYEICYAESDDGFEWEKPLVGMKDFMGHAKTNVVYVGSHFKENKVTYGCSAAQVYKDSEDPDPNRRYKMISYESHPIAGKFERGVSLACSPDGFEWKLQEGPPILDYNSDTGNHVVYDPAEKRWLLFCRPRYLTAIYIEKGEPLPGGYPGKLNLKRRIAVMTSKDFIHWSYPRTVLYPDERDPTDYDWERAFRYGSHILFLYGAMDGRGEKTEEVYLASSRDGFHWERFHGREAFLPRGREGDWDAGQTIINTPPVRQGENLLIYYSGHGRGQAYFASFQGGIGVALMKADRFVEQRAGDDPGFLLTREFILEGNRLKINTAHKQQFHKEQYLRAEIVRHPPIGGHHGFAQAYEGFSRKECTAMKADRIDALVSWQGNSDLSALRGKPVYIRFEMRNVGLYSFRITDE